MLTEHSQRESRPCNRPLSPAPCPGSGRLPCSPVLPGITVACSPGPHLSPRHSQDPHFTTESSSLLYGFMDAWDLIKFKVTCSRKRGPLPAWLAQQLHSQAAQMGVGSWLSRASGRPTLQSCGAQPWVRPFSSHSTLWGHCA